MGQKKAGHATNSFAQMTSDTVLKGLKPTIQQEVMKVLPELYRALSLQLMQERSQMLTRQIAIENLLSRKTDWFSQEELVMEIAKVEDDSSGLEEVSEVKEGDRVRLDLKARAPGAEDWSKPSKLCIQTVATKGPNGNYQTDEEVEQALVGMKTGESKELTINETTKEDGSKEGTLVQVSVKRIARKKE